MVVVEKEAGECGLFLIQASLSRVVAVGCGGAGAGGG